MDTRSRHRWALVGALMATSSCASVVRPYDDRDAGVVLHESDGAVTGDGLAPEANVEIAVGQASACVRRASGTVRCWGAVSARTPGRTTAVTIGGLSEPRQLAIGSGHACARLGDGTVRCWGDNAQFGALGDGTSVTPPGLRPVEVSGLRDVVRIAAGGFHTCALRANGQVWCWGDNAAGCLGDGTTVTRPAPVRVAALDDAVQITVSPVHACARRLGGRVVCWGSGGSYELGDGTTRDHLTPIDVVGTGEVNDVAVGAGHTCISRVDGTVACWGLLHREITEVPLGGQGAALLSAGEGFALALVAGGSVVSWGINGDGQLGTGRQPQDEQPPMIVPGLANVVQVSAGGASACALLGTTRVFCWGENDFGQLGDGSVSDQFSPVEAVDAQ